MIAATLALVVGLTCGQPGAAVAQSPTAAEIERAVERLGSDQFLEREEASKFLWRCGRAAERAVQEAAKSTDLEVRLRARVLLDKFRYGIFPDTRPETIALIQSFRGGDQQARREAWDRLKELGELETLLRLSELDVVRRPGGDWERLFVADAHLLAQSLLLRGDLDQARAWLARSARHADPAPRHYAAFCLLRNELDPAIRQSESAEGQGTDKQQVRLLAHLWRVKGELRRAFALAEQAGDHDLVFDLLYRLEDWAGILDRNRIPGDPGIEKLGFTATFARLAGRDQAAEEAIQAIRQLPLERASYSRMHAEPLMINDRWEETLQLYREHNPHEAFELLIGRRCYDQAFEILGYRPNQRRDRAWLSQFDVPAGEKAESANQRFYPAVALIKTLNQLGLREESLELLADLATVPDDEKQSRTAAIAQLEQELGLEASAREHAVEALRSPSQMYLLRRLFPKRGAEATTWWQFFSKRNADDPPAKKLERVDDILTGKHDAGHAEALKLLVEEAWQMSETLESNERLNWRDALVETCLFHKERDLAMDLLKRVADLAPRAAPYLRLGDLAAEQENWTEAVGWYDRAFQKDRAAIVALFLKAQALERLGNKEQAVRASELANLLPLGDVEIRRRYAEQLQERGFKQQAAEQFELVLRLGPYWSWESGESWAVDNASQHFGNHIVGQDPLRAAACWQRMLHGLLKTNAAFLESAHYAQVVHLVHKAKARGLLERKEIPAALRELKLSDAALPGEIRLATDLVPVLDEAGLPDAGDELFESIYQVNRGLHRLFPDSPGPQNNLAWLAARCRRRLPESLELAQRAVAHSPKNVKYVDTLAEVHYQLGNHALALEHAERCLELAPQNAFYRQRLERIRQRLP